MDSLESNRKLCLQRQTELTRLMAGPDHARAVERFLAQHALLHSAAVAQPPAWSFEDELFVDLPEPHARQAPPGGEHSIAWLLWHSARCEDITLNLLVAGSPQVLLQEGWLERLNVGARDTGNVMDPAQMAAFNAAIDLPALRAYRLAVGRRTREIAARLEPGELRRKVQPARIQRVLEEGAVLAAAWGIAEYWSKRTVAGLLLMPATRHNLIHLQEAFQVKRKLAPRRGTR